MSDKNKVSVLILAASRLGPQDVVAQSQEVSHKCLIRLDGMVMLERVVREIRQSSNVGVFLFPSRTKICSIVCQL